MKRYVIRRLLMAIPLLLAISFVCFVFINLIPSNPAEVALRVQQMPVITEEAVAEMEEMLGLNKPFLVRYFDWVLGCLRGDFGISYVNPARTVAGELARCLPATLQLAAASFVIVLVLSIPIGFLCAVYKDQWFDKLMRGLVFVTTATVMTAAWLCKNRFPKVQFSLLSRGSDTVCKISNTRLNTTNSTPINSTYAWITGKSRLKIELIHSVPSPGQENTFSTTMVPAII